MFGKKKEEEWEYIGDYYRDQSAYDGIDPETAEFKAKTETEYLMGLFKPMLQKDEQILCVIGGGKGDVKNPLESEKTQNAGKVIKTVSSIVTGVIVLGFLALIFGKGAVAKAGFLVVLPYILCSVLIPVIIVVGIVAFIIWSLGSGAKGVNYAITDRRIISYGYGNVDEILFKHIVSTDAHVKSGNMGSITVRANSYRGQKTYMIFRMPKVNEPLRVKYILDQAIENYKMELIREEIE